MRADGGESGNSRTNLVHIHYKGLLLYKAQGEPKLVKCSVHSDMKSLSVVHR